MNENKTLFGLGVLFIALTIFTASNLVAQEMRTTNILWNGRAIAAMEDVIGVKLLPNASASSFVSAMESLGFTILDAPDVMHMARLRLPKGRGILQSIQQVSQTTFVEGAGPIFATHTAVTPNDPAYSNQWGLPKVSASSAWDLTTGTSSIIIGVLDTGIPLQNGSLSHPDLQNSNRILLGSDCVGDGAGVTDKNGHGTHVSGIAAAQTNNSVGVSGMSWNSQVFAVQVFDSGGIGSTYSFYEGVLNAVDNGAKVINFSGGAMSSDYYLEQAIIYARDRNRLIVAAAGNYNPDSNPDKIVEWPAAYSLTYDNVIAVSATNSADALADFSSRGAAVNLSAPGASIYSTLPNYQVRMNFAPFYKSQTYDYVDGTSMAAPLVSGLAALIYSNNSSLSPSQVRQTLQLSADDLGTTGFDTYYGYGRINANKAVRNLYVPQVYSTIAEALNASRSGQTVIVAVGSHNVAANVTVPNGVTLQFSSGTTIDILGNYKIRVEGTLLADGTTFTGSNGQWYGIEVYGASGHISGCTIQNAQYGVYVYATSSFMVDHSTIQNNSVGVANISSTGRISNNYITGNYYGVSCTDYSQLDFQLNNWVKFNSRGVYIDGTSTPQLGTDQNRVYCSIWGNDWDVWSDYGGTINAEWNYWGDYPANPMIYGTVNYSNALMSEPSLYKMAPPSAARVPSTIVEQTSRGPQDTVGMAELDYARALENRSPSTEALSALESVIARYPDRPAALVALAHIAHLVERNGADPTTVLSTYTSTNKASSVGEFAQVLAGQIMMRKGDTEGALPVFEGLALQPGGLFERDALYNAGCLLWYRKGAQAEGEKYFRQLIQKYPKDILSISALATLGESSPGEQLARGKSDLPAAPLAYDLSAAYPNPFNPSTRITFAMPIASEVSLVVYDVLGREMATLLMGYRDSGYHSVVWDATHNASGIYYVRFTATDENGRTQFSKVNKLLLMK